MNTIVILLGSLCTSADVTTEAALDREIKRLAIPDALSPNGKRPLFMVRAEGVQIYEANDKLEWSAATPEAILHDYRTGLDAGTHSKGPTWTHPKGCKLNGKAIAKVPAPNPDAIPWLLIEVTNQTGGPYANVTHIQRIDTWAGVKPVALPTKAGETVKVRYQATYIFWGSR